MREREKQCNLNRLVEPLYDLIVPERRLTGGSFTQQGPIDSALHRALPANRLIAPDHCLIYFFTRSTDVIVPVHWRMLWKFAALISARASVLPLPVFPQDLNATVCIFYFIFYFYDILLSRWYFNLEDQRELRSKCIFAMSHAFKLRHESNCISILRSYFGICI